MSVAVIEGPPPAPQETGHSSGVQAYYHRILPFFDLELSDRGDAGFWTRAAAGTPCRVLELGAGTGRATAFLARHARRVVAFDLSPELVATARRRLAGLSHVTLFVADMRDVRLRARFDLVVAVDDPFVHLILEEDRDRALATVARHLAPEGRFLLDAAWLPPERGRVASGDQGWTGERSVEGSGLRVRETWRCDPGSRICTARWEYRLGGRCVEEASFQARLWSVEELERRGRRAGLRISRLWGDFDGRPWHRATSPSLIVEMRAAEDPFPYFTRSTAHRATMAIR